LDDIASIIFTATSDIDAAFPAAAVREIGIVDIPLMCMKEIDVENSLEMCIRVLIHFNTNKSNNELCHIYLKNATRLRPDLVK